MTVTFFGHRTTPPEIADILRKELISLIETQGADTFYVGHQGAFDAMVRKTLKELKKHYPFISYAVVLAYLPQKRNEYDTFDDTIYPEGLETVPKKYAISHRNRWMVEQCDCVVAYVAFTDGGAAQFVRLAEKKGKQIRNLADPPSKHLLSAAP